MRKGLISSLILPLIIFSIGSAFAHRYLNWDGFFLNLSTELIGIILTVSYIDWIVQRQKEEEWKNAQVRIKVRIRNFLDSTVASVRVSLKFGLDKFDMSLLGSDPVTRHNEVLKVIQDVLEPEVRARVPLLATDDWKYFEAELRKTLEDVDKIFMIFSNNLSPAQYTPLIEIRDAVNKIVQFASLIIRIAPSSNQDVKLFIEKLLDMVSEELRILLSAVRGLSRTL